MKLTIWVVFGIFETAGEQPVIALFLDKTLAEIRRSKWDKNEDCLETRMIRFETEFTMTATNNELKPIEEGK